MSRFKLTIKQLYWSKYIKEDSYEYDKCVLISKQHRQWAILPYSRTNLAVWIFSNNTFWQVYSPFMAILCNFNHL